MLGKTWTENNLVLMPYGTSRILGGKLCKKPNRNLRPVVPHLKSPAPAPMDDLGWGRGGLQGGGSGGAWVGEGDGGGPILGWEEVGSRERAPAVPGWGSGTSVGSSL